MGGVNKFCKIRPSASCRATKLVTLFCQGGGGCKGGVPSLAQSRPSVSVHHQTFFCESPVSPKIFCASHVYHQNFFVSYLCITPKFFVSCCRLFASLPWAPVLGFFGKKSCRRNPNAKACCLQPGRASGGPSSWPGPATSKPSGPMGPVCQNCLTVQNNKRTSPGKTYTLNVSQLRGGKVSWI